MEENLKTILLLLFLYLFCFCFLLRKEQKTVCFFLFFFGGGGGGVFQKFERQKKDIKGNTICNVLGVKWLF